MSDQGSTLTTQDVVDWTELGRETWSFLTGRHAAINDQFVDMAVEVPRDTGATGSGTSWDVNDRNPRAAPDLLARSEPVRRIIPTTV